jgi:hypothetical protein
LGGSAAGTLRFTQLVLLLVALLGVLYVFVAFTVLSLICRNP